MDRATYSGVCDAEPTWSTVLTSDGYSAYVSTTSTHRKLYTNTNFDARCGGTSSASFISS